MSDRKSAKEPREEALEIWRRAFGGGSTSDDGDADRERAGRGTDQGSDASRDESDDANRRSNRG